MSLFAVLPGSSISNTPSVPVVTAKRDTACSGIWAPDTGHRTPQRQGSQKNKIVSYYPKHVSSQHPTDWNLQDSSTGARKLMRG
eukprot:1159129-Pelagomonas_calceolata.AAC.12